MQNDYSTKYIQNLRDREREREDGSATNWVMKTKIHKNHHVM